MRLFIAFRRQKRMRHSSHTALARLAQDGILRALLALFDAVQRSKRSKQHPDDAQTASARRPTDGVSDPGPPRVSPAFDVVSQLDPLKRKVILVVSGTLDVYTSPQLRAKLVDIVAAGGWNTLVIDLREVTFLDSKGVGVLVLAKGHAHTGGKDVVLVVTRPAIRRLLEITGMTELFLIIEDPAVLD